jgi:DnaJ-class molecular chaperone
MIENMGMEEMISNLEGDYKIETLQIKRASKQKKEAARVAAMTEEEREEEREEKRASKQKRDAERLAART